eukprot:s177_g16.t2
MSRRRGPGAAAIPVAERRWISREELWKHRWRRCPQGVGQNCWISIRGLVLQLPAELFAQHPGGTEVLRDAAGHDVTDAFEAVHGDEAKAWADAYVIGGIIVHMAFLGNKLLLPGGLSPGDPPTLDRGKRRTTVPPLCWRAGPVGFLVLLEHQTHPSGSKKLMKVSPALIQRRFAIWPERFRDLQEAFIRTYTRRHVCGRHCWD